MFRARFGKFMRPIRLTVHKKAKSRMKASITTNICMVKLTAAELSFLGVIIIMMCSHNIV